MFDNVIDRYDRYDRICCMSMRAERRVNYVYFEQKRNQMATRNGSKSGVKTEIERRSKIGVRDDDVVDDVEVAGSFNVVVDGVAGEDQSILKQSTIDSTLFYKYLKRLFYTSCRRYPLNV
ncbi:hypothetical protein EVAR_92093_1 [Eumeta japonica]|uniref:Uncharacterized protein n=1 Tax=Eumeta variegata TaxID=151549 RepID=A0A4C1T134_EUMVA|nr:hypothetical protein EVAR_92093_1 [Eumeta japonica]